MIFSSFESLTGTLVVEINTLSFLGFVQRVRCYLQAKANVLLHKALDGSLEVLDLVVELTLAVGKNGASNDRTGDSAGKTKGNLAGDKHVMHVLFFAHEGQVQKDLKGLSIGGQNDQIGLLTVQRLSSCIQADKLHASVLGSLKNGRVDRAKSRLEPTGGMELVFGRTFVGTLLELLVVQGLLNKIENDIVEGSIGARNGFGVHFGRLTFRRGEIRVSTAAKGLFPKQKHSHTYRHQFKGSLLH